MFSAVASRISGEMESISPEGLPPDPPDAVPPSASKKRHLNEEQVGPIKKTIIDQESASASIQTIYTHPSMSILGIRSYETTDSGPFIVHVSRVEPDPAAGTTIRPIKFGQFLYQNKIEHICQDGVKKVGRNKISIQFKSASGANNFLNNSMLQKYKYEATIPTYNVTRMGLVRGVPVDWSMDEFVESLQTPGYCTQILKARRLNRKNKSEGTIVWEPTQTVVLTFRGQELPLRVFSYYSSLEVETYQYPTIQCMNCCRFGHIKAQCRSKPRCYRCAQPHLGDDCLIPEAESTCLYCSAKHFSTSRTCPEQNRQKSIKTVMSRDGVSYEEASSQFRKITKPYSQAVQETTSSQQQSSPPPPSNAPSPYPSQSYNKTVTRSPHPKAPLGKSYDRVAHQNIVSEPPSSFPNGSAFQMSQPSPLPREASQDQLLAQLLTIIISIISQNSINLPSNVAHMITQLSSLITHNGSHPNPSMERQKPPSKDS